MQRRKLGLVLCGAFLFGAAMTRGTGVLLPLLLGAYAPHRGPTRRSRLLRLALLHAVVIALFVPWWIRNHLAFGGFVPIANNGGVNLYIGNNPLATGGYRFDRAVTAQLPDDVNQGWLGSGGLKEYEIDRTLTHIAQGYIATHVLETLARFPAKLRYLYMTDHTPFEWTRSRRFQTSSLFERAYGYNQLYYGMLWTLAAAGAAVLVLSGRARWQQVACLGLATLGALFIGLHPWGIVTCALLSALGLARHSNDGIRPPRLAYACIGAFTAFQLVYFGDARFHHAMMPWVCMGGGVWCAFAIGVCGPPRRPRSERS